MNANLIEIEKALHDLKHETARRLALAELAKNPANGNEVRKCLHEAYLRLGDFSGVHQLLDEIKPADDTERLEITLLHATDYLNSNKSDYWRDSPESKAGMTNEQVHEKMDGLGEKYFKIAAEQAGTEAQRSHVAKVMIGAGKKKLAEELGLPLPQEEAPAPKPSVTEFGSVSGTVKFADGKPGANLKLTFGLKTEWHFDNPVNGFNYGLGDRPTISRQETFTTTTDANGAFRFEKIPAGRQDFIAVSLDPQEYDISTRYLAHYPVIEADHESKLDLVIREWTSAPTREVKSPFTESITVDGVKGRRVFEQVLKNPFYFNFPRQLIRIPVPPGVTTNPERLVLLSAPDAAPEPIQLSGRELLFFVALPEKTDKIYALYELEKTTSATPPANMVIEPQQDGTAIVETGRSKFKIPFGQGTDAQPPLLAVQGPDGVWRGQGRFRLPQGVGITSRKTQVIELGPLLLEWSTSYQLSNGASYEIRFTAHQGEAYLLAHEFSPAIEGASFEFSLKEFSGGRGYLHWKPERNHSHSWEPLVAENIELARLQESTPWWLPRQGFGYVMTADGLEKKDYIGVFTIRRGDWIDRKFASLVQGPKNEDGTENRELDWPFCEMVGSTISMITAESDSTGDAYFKFGFFNGERHWGILVSDFALNDGMFKEFSAVQHKNSSPRLQDFKDWHLDEPDHVQRPFVVAQRKDLKEIRRKVKTTAFAPFWKRIIGGDVRRGGATQGLAFAVEGDPVTGWHRKTELIGVAAMRSKMTLLGRDYSDNYSPVGGRNITPWAEEFDLIAASGVFTPEEERETRAFLMLMGHLFMSPDLMNWKYNSRNANFEADRVDVVGAVGFTFHGNPDADKMVEHAADLMEKSLNIYCTPGSGKWYENPACYYLHASKCRLNLAFHLAMHDVQDPTRLPRMKDFLSWAIILLTPPCPHDYDVMRDGISAEEYAKIEKVRRVPPIGDHAHLGSWVPDHYAFMSKLYRDKDPEFADMLLWAHQAGGSDGGYYSNAPLIVSGLTESDLAPAPATTLASRRLEGFGAVFRGSYGQDDEFYLLFKQGPAGYRYHRTEGSIVLFADGKPLIYDGGEAGETWRHTTLSFYDAHMPLACGHVERFASFPGIDFAQGVHPLAIKPGDPVFLNDTCHHLMVPEAWRRYAEPDPINVRSVIWIKDEYVIMHDDLHLDPSIPSYWHLQAVAHSETGNARDGYVFKGRFGTDLQVQLPDQTFVEEGCDRHTILEYYRTKEDSFAMRHLQLKADKPDHYLAVLRPLARGKGLLRSRAFRHTDRVRGVFVEGDGINDMVIFSRDPFSLNEGGVRFEGRYAAILQRADNLQLSLLGGSLLEVKGLRIESSAPTVFLRAGHGGTEIDADGHGTVTVTVVATGKSSTFEVAGKFTARLAS